MKEGDGSLSADGMIRDVIAGQDAVTRSCRAALAIANKADDQPTVDIMVQRLQIHEINAWMLRSLIDNGAANLLGSVTVQWSVALAVLGVGISARSGDKRAAQGADPGGLSSLIGKVLGR